MSSFSDADAGASDERDAAALDAAPDAEAQSPDAADIEPADADTQPDAASQLTGPGELRVGAYVQPLHDVTRIQYRVFPHDSDCDEEPLDQFESPVVRQLSFLGHSVILDAGEYLVCATALADGGPSDHCQMMRLVSQIYPDSVTEQIFPFECEPVTHPETKQRYTVTPPVIGYHDAAAKAEAMGGYLAVVNSEQEHLFLLEEFRGRAWIGLADPELDGTFEWINGEPLQFTAWCEGEPNQLGPEYWTEWGFRSDGCWNDVAVGPTKGLVEIDAN